MTNLSRVAVGDVRPGGPQPNRELVAAAMAAVMKRPSPLRKKDERSVPVERLNAYSGSQETSPPFGGRETISIKKMHRRTI